LENNLNLRKNRIDLAASGYSEKRLWSEIFPSINANAGIGYRNTLFSSTSLSGSGLNYSMGFGVNFGLNAGIPYAMKSIQLAHQGNILKYEDARNQLTILITRKFFTLIAEKNNITYLSENLNLAQKQYERDMVSFRNGLIKELTLIQSRMAVENARYNLSTAATVHANNMVEYLAMLGMEEDINVILLGEINITRIEADAQSLIGQYLSGRPDIVQSRREIERFEYVQRQMEMQNHAPSLNLSMDWNITDFGPFSDNVSATARLSIPIDSWIPGTSKSQALMRADDSVEKAKLDLAMTEDAAKTHIRSLTASLRNSWNSIEIARLGLNVAEHSYQLTEQGFRNGTVEFLVLEDSRNNMANAKQRLLQSELSYFNMILDLSSSLNIDWKYLIQTFGVSSEKE
jgi:multidrug efflux system outer membrane protein